MNGEKEKAERERKSVERTRTCERSSCELERTRFRAHACCCEWMSWIPDFDLARDSARACGRERVRTRSKRKTQTTRVALLK